VLGVVRSSLCRLARVIAALAAASALAGCGEEGLFPTTVDKGGDFNVADVVFDAGYFYCRVEPVLFGNRCGPGVSGTDAANSCHYNVTSFRLSDYTPLVADSCGDGIVPGVSPPGQAQQNYQVSQARMDTNPDSAALILRPTGKAKHPREIFASDSPEAETIRAWATQFSTQ
jgi:hypothetical protein